MESTVKQDRWDSSTSVTAAATIFYRSSLLVLVLEHKVPNLHFHLATELD